MSKRTQKEENSEAKESAKETYSTDDYHPNILTEGIVESLEYFYTICNPAGITSYCMSAPTSYMCLHKADRGWGCGYRNVQMVISSLLRNDPYASVLGKSGVGCIPTISRIQELIDAAWSQGYDGEESLNLEQLSGTQRPIGALEVTALYRSLCLEAKWVEFSRPTGANQTHPLLFRWIRAYLRTGRAPAYDLRCLERGKELAASGPRAMFTRVNVCRWKKPSIMSNTFPVMVDVRARADFPPLFLQSQGQSWTVIGLEEDGSDYPTLLVLDPNLTSENIMSVMRYPLEYIHLLKRSLEQFQASQFHLVYLEWVITTTPEDKRSERLRDIHPSQQYP